MTGSREVLGSLVVLGMVLSTFTAAASVVETSLSPKSIPHLSLAPPDNWWNSSWQYRKPITITNSGSALTDYQVLFEVDTASLIPAGKMRPDSGDLMFVTSGGTELSYWIESGASTSSTKVWVKVPSIPAGTSTIYMYYGNSSATGAEDGDATFIFFDNFDTIDTTKWNQTTGWSVSNGVIYAAANDKNLVSVQSWSFSGKAIHTRVRTNEVAPRPQPRFLISSSDGTDPWKSPSITTINSADGVSTVDLYTGTLASIVTYSVPWNTNWHNIAHKKADGSVVGTYDGESKTVSTGIPDTIYVAFRVDGGIGTVTLYIDHVFMRKYVDSEPMYSFGSEEYVGGEVQSTALSETVMSISPPIFSLYPGYSGQVQSLTATLRDANHNPLEGKTITWLATSGSVSPSSSVTDALGQVTVTYTAPTVTADTPPATITASFAGDAQYESSSGTSSGVPAVPVSESIPAENGGTIVINVVQINITVNILMVPPNALPEDTTVTVVEAPSENVSNHAMVSEIFDIGPGGISFTTPSTLTLPYDENELPEDVDEDDLAIYRRTSSGGSWECVGGTVDKAANTVSVEIDHLSEYAVMAQLPTQPFVAAPLPVWVMVAAALALVIAMTAVIWRHLRQARGDATSILIEHGLPSMRIAEVEVVREIIDMGEFTIPEIMQRTNSSKILVWRTVKKLMEKGLVEPTEKVKPPAAGRGKPSMGFKYVGD